ncbi:THAP domain-containing protein 2-like [Amyelois transitella]|uniref:THAP domain-containing protein 2-like n=1 Tax=Amyelois transitella TaxID=680683 RepID=UPI00298F8121|nr:THAP domain-containing protein 2-like [Amyelois transitella]
MVKCAVKSCKFRAEKDEKLTGVSFHKVPKDQKRREEWIKIIRLLRQEADWLPSAATVVCSKHVQEVVKEKEEPTICNAV